MAAKIRWQQQLQLQQSSVGVKLIILDGIRISWVLLIPKTGRQKKKNNKSASLPSSVIVLLLMQKYCWILDDLRHRIENTIQDRSSSSSNHCLTPSSLLNVSTWMR